MQQSHMFHMSDNLSAPQSILTHAMNKPLPCIVLYIYVVSIFSVSAPSTFVEAEAPPPTANTSSCTTMS